MLRTHKRVVAAVAVAAVVAAGAGVAIAANREQSPQQESQTVLNEVARELGVTPAKLRTALENALVKRVDAAVADGRLTREQADRLEARIRSGDVPLLSPRPHPRRAHGPFGRFGRLDAAASYLGVDHAELREALRSGRSLADVARENGKSVDGLVSALTNAATERLEAAVAAGRLTDAQRDEIASRLEQRIRRFVDGTFERGRRGGFGRGGRGGSESRDTAFSNTTF